MLPGVSLFRACGSRSSSLFGLDEAEARSIKDCGGVEGFFLLLPH
jgi:hypothetical protein